ncbi:MAG: nSTAND1 domain-containing NTPase, partial [Conexibacter sp.]
MIGDRRVAAPPATPFRGISPFRYADHAIFCAREAETRRLGQLVTVYRGVLLYGDSGAGKSSLVNAGLISHMTERGLLAQRLRVQPRRGEELVLEPLAISDRGSETLPMLGGGDGENGAVCSAAGFARLVEDACDHVRPLLIFDQFEEIVTLFEEAGAEDLQRDVLRLIVELIHSSLPVKVLLVFREDYLGRIKELLTDCPDLVDQALRLAAPQRDALDTIIRGPFERNPGCFSHELSPSLAARLRELLGERFGSGEVSLSEVQTVCLRLWQSSDPDRLLEERGIQGLLEDYLGEELDAFQPDLRRAAIALLSQMVTSAGTRNVITAEDLLDRVQAEEEIPRPRLELALAQLEGTSRLVRRERRRHLDLYEITSEFLVPWISERRELQRRQQERRRLRVLAGLLGVGLLVLVIVGALALWALSQRNAARRSATAATALDLSVASRAQLDGRLDVALLLALDAYLTSPRFETWSSLVGALETARESGALAILHGHEDFVRSVAVSPDGKTIASGGNDGTVRVWSVAAHRQVALLARAHRSVIASIDYSPDGRLLAAGGGDGVVSLWDVARRRLAGRQPPRQPHDVTALAFSPGGHMLATAASDGTLRLWDVAGRQPIGQPFGYVHGALTSV